MSAALTGPGHLRPAPGPRGLRRFTTPRPAPEERCELCGVRLPDERHRHLVDIEKRALACACPPCAALLDRPGASGGRFRAVPGRYLSDPDHRIDHRTWELLRIPVGVAFLFRNTALGRPVALYPSPAGATESELEPSDWETVLAATRLAEELEPDVEALLLRRGDGRRADGRRTDTEGDRSTECHLVPVDICYALVGRMRQTWQGFDGGAEARAALDAFFDDVRLQAGPPQGSRP
ncbi:DUF5947 family protein [Streptomyces sp. NPDC007861]|uniref:DUF5947 family protein n=1 Tax=Streptomyces sp. NPDC007861 TaxID=3154893 RepID=UPI0033EEC357